MAFEIYTAALRSIDTAFGLSADDIRKGRSLLGGDQALRIRVSLYMAAKAAIGRKAILASLASQADQEDEWVDLAATAAKLALVADARVILATETLIENGRVVDSDGFTTYGRTEAR